MQKLKAPTVTKADRYDPVFARTFEEYVSYRGFVIERHRRASTIVTSNRSIDEWIPLFDDPILALAVIQQILGRPLGPEGRSLIPATAAK